MKHVIIHSFSASFRITSGQGLSMETETSFFQPISPPRIVALPPGLDCDLPPRQGQLSGSSSRPAAFSSAHPKAKTARLSHASLSSLIGRAFNRITMRSYLGSQQMTGGSVTLKQRLGRSPQMPLQERELRRHVHAPGREPWSAWRPRPSLGVLGRATQTMCKVTTRKRSRLRLAVKRCVGSA